MKKLDLGLKRRDRVILKGLLVHGEHHAREMMRAMALTGMDPSVLTKMEPLGEQRVG